MRRRFDGSPEVDQVTGTSTFRKIARIFDERVPHFGQLPVDQKRRLARHIPADALCRPIHREHPRGGPIRRQRSRPGKLDGWIKAMARNRARSGRQTERQNQRNIEAGFGTELLFHSDREIAKAGAEVVRNRQAQLGSRRHSESQQSFRTVEDALPLAGGFGETILELEASLRNHDAGIRHRGTVGVDGRRGTIACSRGCRSKQREDRRQDRPAD